MTDIFERRRRKPDYLDSALVMEHTAQKIALWCGGVVNRELDRGVDPYTELLVPNVEGTQKAHVNDYVVRKEDGRFYVMTMTEMEEYEVLGQREEIAVAPVVDGARKTPHYVRRGQHPFGALG
jgi:sugar lactone lactonase YvrE